MLHESLSPFGRVVLAELGGEVRVFLGLALDRVPGRFGLLERLAQRALQRLRSLADLLHDLLDLRIGCHAGPPLETTGPGPWGPLGKAGRRWDSRPRSPGKQAASLRTKGEPASLEEMLISRPFDVG